MLKVDEQWLRRVEQRYPGIRQTIEHHEALNLPPYSECGSADTAAVSAGIVGGSTHVGAATTKMRLLPHDVPEDYYCNACGRYFGGPNPDEGAQLEQGSARDRGSLLLDPRTATDDDLEAFCRALRTQAEKGARVQRRSQGR